MWHNWSSRRRWLFSLSAVLALAVLAGAGASCSFLRIPKLPLPAAISKHTETVRLAGKSVKVDCYLPQATGPAPVVVVAHGFSRNRNTMAGWGALLAQEGFIAAVPDLPFWSDHAGNGRALIELLARMQAGDFLQQPRPSSRLGVVGFSAGGLATLIAAAGDTNIACWVGLDPVGMGRQTEEAAAMLKIPCFVLRAEPSPWNAHGNARQIFAALPGPAFSLVVRDATHVDAEHPTSRAAEWACGKSDPARREVFGRYLLASLRTGLLADEASLRTLHAATNNPAVYAAEFRRPEAMLQFR